MHYRGRPPVLRSQLSVVIILLATGVRALAADAAADAPKPVAGATSAPPASPVAGPATTPAATGAAPEGTAPGPSAAAAPAPSVTSPSTSTSTPSAAEAGAAPPPVHRMVASLSHDLQFGLGLLIGDGYRGIYPYKKNIYCGNAGAKDSTVCTNRAPTFVDLDLSFGISESWDVLTVVRFGIEKDFNTERQLMFMPGFRYWLDPQSHVKFFVTVQLGYDVSKQNNPLVKNTDIGFRNSNGLMFEVMRNFGVYAQFGETIGFVRWLSFLVDGGVGLQARLP